MPEKDDQELIRGFVRKLTEHQAALRAFVGYLVGGAGCAADIVQEVNLLLWEKRGQFEPGSNFRAWAFTTARYVTLGYRRQMRKDGLLIFDPDLVESLADEWEAQPNEHERKLAILEDCLEKLTDEEQSLIRLRYSGHGEIERLAQKSGGKGANFRLRLFRLRAALKQCVQRELKIEGGLA